MLDQMLTTIAATVPPKGLKTRGSSSQKQSVRRPFCRARGVLQRSDMRVRKMSAGDGVDGQCKFGLVYKSKPPKPVKREWLASSGRAVQAPRRRSPNASSTCFSVSVPRHQASTPPWTARASHKPERGKQTQALLFFPVNSYPPKKNPRVRLCCSASFAQQDKPNLFARTVPQ